MGGGGRGPGAEEPAWVGGHGCLEAEQGLPLAVGGGGGGRWLSGRGEEEQEEEESG